MPSRLWCACVGSLVLSMGLTGCGGGGVAGSISGKVSYKGAPVTGGTINFHFAGGKVAPGSIDSNGNYTAQTPTTGTAQVAIETESIKPGPLVAEGDSSGGLTYVRIPAKYADHKTSMLTVDLKSGAQKKDFELVD